MAQVPYDEGAGPSVQPDTHVPDDYQHIQASPDAFGGAVARGMEQFGAGATKASQFYGQIAADDVMNNYVDRDNKRLYGDPSVMIHGPDGTMIPDTGYFGKKGADQLAAREQLMKDRDADLKSFRGQLQTPESQFHFDEYSRRYRLQTDARIGESAERAYSDYGVKTNQGQFDQANQDAARHAADEAAFNGALENAKSAAAKTAHIQGLTGDAVKSKVDAAANTLWQTRIETLGVKDPGAAFKMAMDHQADLGTLFATTAERLRVRAEDAAGEAAGAAAHANATSAAAGGAAPGGSAAPAASDTAYYAKIPKPADGVYAKIPAVGEHGENQAARFQQWNSDPVGNSAAALNTVHPDLQAIVRKAQADNPNLPFVVGLGKSTPEQEAQAKQWGWAPDSSSGGSHHLQGDVVDLWPMDKQGHVVFDKAQQQQINAAMQKAAGELGLKLRWGGLQGEGGQNESFRDAPNFQLVDPKPWTAGAAPAGGFHPTAPAAAPPAAGAAAPVSGAVTPERMSGAILGQESGNNPLIGNSIDGAVGMGQIMPATFAQYAKPGESIRNPGDNLAVHRRIIADYMQRYGGDPARVAVAYFSGPGNVASLVSKTPWKNDSADGNGKSVSSYVNDVLHRLSRPGIADAAPGSWDAAATARSLGAHPDLTGAMPSFDLGGAPSAPAPSTVTPPPAPPPPAPASPAPVSPEAIKAAALAEIDARTDLTFGAKNRAKAVINEKVAYDQLMAASADKAKKDASDKAAGDFTTRILTGTGGPGIVQEIARDQNLEWSVKEKLFEQAVKHSGNDYEEAKQAYGPGFWDRLKGATTGDGPRPTYADLMAHTGKDGDLTLSGVAAIMKSQAETAKNPDAKDIEKAKIGQLAALKQKLSFDQEMLIPGVPQSMARDPKGEQIFNQVAIGRYLSMYDKWTTANPTKDPYEFLNDPKRIDDLAEELRPQRQMKLERMAAGGAIHEQANSPIHPLPENAPDGVAKIWPQIAQGVLDPKTNTRMLPDAPDGTPMSHYAWGEILKFMIENPTRVAELRALPRYQPIAGAIAAAAAEMFGPTGAPRPPAVLYRPEDSARPPPRPDGVGLGLKTAPLFPAHLVEGGGVHPGNVLDPSGQRLVGGIGETIRRAWGADGKGLDERGGEPIQ